MFSSILSFSLYAHIQQNPAKLRGQRFTVQMSNDPKQTMMAIKEFLKAKKGNNLQCSITEDSTLTETTQLKLLSLKLL